jgi:hypothetical protein
LKKRKNKNTTLNGDKRRRTPAAYKEGDNDS